jgi:hypothetical protein
MASAVAGRPHWLPESDSTTDVTTFWSIGSQLAGVLRDSGGRAVVEPHERLGALLGSSTLECSVDPALLETESKGRPIRWLSLTGPGVNAGDLERMGRLLLRSGLRPDITVFVMSPGVLAQTDSFLSDPVAFDLAAVRRHLAERHPMLAKEEAESILLAPWNRAFPNRTRVSHWLRTSLFQARLDLFAKMGYGVAHVFAPRHNPWLVSTWTQKQHAAPDFLETQMKGWRGKGWFNRASYSPDGPEMRNFLRLIRTLCDAGSEVVIVLVPESSRLRNSIPPAAVNSLATALNRAFGPTAPPVLNLRDAIPDPLFFDLVHLDPDGRVAFTKHLAQALDHLAPLVRNSDSPGLPRRNHGTRGVD